MTASGQVDTRQEQGCPPMLHGEGLLLRAWDASTICAAAAWGRHPFPYHGFNLDHLLDPPRAAAMLQTLTNPGTHLHFVAIEGGVPVGRVSVNLGDRSGLYLWGVHVPPEHEGRAVCRRMLAVLLRWLERTQPGRDFTLNSSGFAEHAHRAYFALGFRITETAWHYDRDISEAMWRASQPEREAIRRHLRFVHGRWEVRTFVMRRDRGSPMDSGPARGLRTTAAAGRR